MIGVGEPPSFFFNFLMIGIFLNCGFVRDLSYFSDKMF